MKIFRTIDSFDKAHLLAKGTIVTAGTFDGVHLGHQGILRRIKELSQNTGAQTLLITYHPHPRLVLFPDKKDLQLLSTIEEKIDLLSAHGVDNLLIIPFTLEFAAMSGLEFIKQILVGALGTTKLVIGYDHKFGRNREGSFEFLKANAESFGFSLEEISRHDVDDIAVSSSKIRKALLGGNVLLARQLLGRNYRLSGTVVKGKQLGRTIGYPTANLALDEAEKLVPADGVYAVKVRYDGVLTSHDAVMSIGNNPTVTGTGHTLEVHILDFAEDLYGKKLEVEFIGYIRPEAKFDGLDALVAAIDHDVVVARQMLKAH